MNFDIGQAGRAEVGLEILHATIQYTAIRAVAAVAIGAATVGLATAATAATAVAAIGTATAVAAVAARLIQENVRERAARVARALTTEARELLQPGTRDVEQKDIDDEKTCRICLDGFEKPGRIYNHTIGKIDHSYHYDCMLKWAVVCIKNNPNTPNPITCPLCNLKITAS